MSFQDPPRRERMSRYPSLAQYEDGYPPYQDSQGYQPYQPYQGYQSYQDTEAGYRNENGYADEDQGFTGLVGRRGFREQRPPWEDPGAPAETRTEWQPEPGTEWPPTQRRTSGPFLAASGDNYETSRDDEYGRPRHLAGRGQQRGRGLLPGAVAGFLAAAVAIGVANLVAAAVRPQASPIIAVGGWFIDHTPPALKNFAVQKFGENDKNMLLLGMYVTIGIIALVIGMLAWRRLMIGVAGIGLFGLFGAYIAITRPESHVTDVIPSIIGGIVGIATIVWLVRMGTAKPIGATRTTRARGTRRGAVWAGGNS